MRHANASRVKVVGQCAALILALAGTVGVASQSRPGTAGLPDLFRIGAVLQDRNGDGVVDFVNARIVMGDHPSAGDVAAAANIAARLGFETSAMNLPLRSAPPERFPIIVGAAGARRAGVAMTGAGSAPLRPGEGVVRLVDVTGAPGLLVAGADDAATRAAANVLAGRLPYLTDEGAASLDTVVADIEAFLSRRGIRASSVALPAVRVAAAEPQLDLLVAEVHLSPANQARAQQALAATARSRSVSRSARTKTAVAGEGAETELSYPGLRAMRVELVTEGAKAVAVDVPAAPIAADAAIPTRRPGTGAKAALDLSSIFGNDGLLGDSDGNLIPDRTDALLVPAGPGSEGTVELAARLGLESAGIALPLAVSPEEIARPEAQPTLVLIGTSHPLIGRLVEEKKFDPGSLQPGEGLIALVDQAFGDRPAVIVTGGDAVGVERALRQIAERFPHVWHRGRDRTTLDGIEDDVRRFLAGRSPAGQAATALYKLDRLADELAGKDLESAHIRVSVENAADGLGDFIRREMTGRIKASTLDVTIENRHVQRASPIVVRDRPISAEVEIASEVDEFWQVFRQKVLPAVRKRQPVVVEALLSEPPDVRAAIERDARAELIKAGAADAGTSVTVLSAFKQGFSWLYDVVRPALAGRQVEEIVITFAEIGAPIEWPQQAMYTPTRWLLELSPIDEVLARELRLDLKKIRFQKAPIGSPTYQVVATGPGGQEILRQTFEPRYVLRSFFDQFPNYEKVRVTTGWITARVGTGRVVDQRIVTDPERFWDYFQGTTLPAIYEYVMTLTDGKPRAEDAPHFGELTVDLTLSEPNYLLGIDKEHISSMESMHEEVYFSALHFFDLLGKYARGPGGLDYPGRVIPIMRPKGDGKPGLAKITFTGFTASRPSVRVTYTERGGREGELRLDVPKVAVERPTTVRALVLDGRDGVARLDLRVKVDTVRDERDRLILAEREDRVDARVMSAAQATAIVANLARLHAAGLYRDALAYHGLGLLQITATSEHQPTAAAQMTAELEPNGAPAALPDITTLLPAGWRHSSDRIVQWDTPIPPPEANELLAKFSTFKEATVYKVGRSYLGKDIWAMDLMPPIEASHWSQAKATTLKPTVVYSGRQHANEVSSTSHVLRLAELLVTDPAYRKKLDKVNVVIHPITNPDGAQLAYDLYRITPDFMLHAGYLGSLGVDVTNAQWETDPIYPESGIRPAIWRTWLPDVFLNPHGYPSHEWVQLFSEYAGWVRNRATHRHEVWGMRGWYLPGMNYIDDKRYPRHKAAAFEISRRIAANLNAVPDIKALNERGYDWFRRYGWEWDPATFKRNFTDGVMMYKSITGSRPDPRAGDFAIRQPNITIWSSATEAPDETAYGDWMKLCATMGLQFDRALLDYLVEGEHVVERKRDSFVGGVTLSLSRARPAKSGAVTKTTDDFARR